MVNPRTSLLFSFLVYTTATIITIRAFTVASDSNIKDRVLAKNQSITESFVQCLYVIQSQFDSGQKYPIKGSVYTPADKKFPSVLTAYARNSRFTTPSTPKPLAIVTAAHDSHIQAAIVCAKQNGLQVRIRSGGHNFEGVSYVSPVPFIIIDMFKFRTINVNAADKTAWVQAGALLGEVYHAIANASNNTLAFPAGVCLGIGFGGHLSGGGYGPMMRTHGLTVDHVLDAWIIDYRARILNRASMGEDTFWAINGGGASSFCVVLGVKISLVGVPTQVTVFRAARNSSSSSEAALADLVLKYQRIATVLDNNLFLRLVLSAQNSTDDSRTQTSSTVMVASFEALYLGPASQALNVMTKSFPELGIVREDCNEMTWLQATLFWAGFPIDNFTTVALAIRSPGSSNFYKAKSDYVNTVTPKEGVSRLFSKMMSLGPEEVTVQLNPYGGKMKAISESATPMPHRNNLFLVQYGSTWLDPSRAAEAHYFKVAREVYDLMSPYVSSDPRESFLNYQDFEIGASDPSNNATVDYARDAVYGRKYFKYNYQRLMLAKSIIDPTDFFKNEQSIPPLPS